MARKNRKRSKRMSVVARRAMFGASFIGMVAVVTILNLLASSNCTHLMKEIGRKERLIEKLDGDLARESARWEAMMASVPLEQSLRNFGMSMHYAKPSQIVRLDANGRPRPGQISVARMAERSAAARTAQYAKPARRR
jgi:hypothetical protein